MKLTLKTKLEIINEFWRRNYSDSCDDLAVLRDILNELDLTFAGDSSQSLLETDQYHDKYGPRTSS